MAKKENKPKAVELLMQALVLMSKNNAKEFVIEQMELTIKKIKDGA